MTEQIKELAEKLARFVYTEYTESVSNLLVESYIKTGRIHVWADDLCIERGISTLLRRDDVLAYGHGDAPASFWPSEYFKDHPSRREAITVCRLKALIKSYEGEAK